MDHGPGRWGSADRWLGIPVKWSDINGVQAIVGAAHPSLRADPSQGSHFFHNITTLGITYISAVDENKDILDWSWLTRLPTAETMEFIAHVHLTPSLTLKVDGRKTGCAIYRPDDG